MSYQFWPQRSSLAVAAKVFILALPNNQMWHYWKESQCSNVRSQSVVMKLLSCATSKDHFNRSIMQSVKISCLPSARLFVCLVLNVSTLALHFCVGVDSDPHLQGFFSLSPFLFFLSGCGIRILGKTYMLPHQVRPATVKGRQRGKKWRQWDDQHSVLPHSNFTGS